MKDDRKVAALWTGKGEKTKIGETLRFPGSGTRYTVQENGSVVNPDKSRLTKKEKRKIKRGKVIARKAGLLFQP
jgi:hypothetical protein